MAAFPQPSLVLVYTPSGYDLFCHTQNTQHFDVGTYQECGPSADTCNTSGFQFQDLFSTEVVQELQHVPVGFGARPTPESVHCVFLLRTVLPLRNLGKS